jgi:hypothetical protein
MYVSLGIVRFSSHVIILVITYLLLFIYQFQSYALKGVFIY